MEVVMYRTAIEDLKRWKERTDRKPLLIRGARQTGKTWLMKEFGKTSYEQYAYINFESNSGMKNLFISDFDIERLLSGLQVEAGCPIIPGKTLIIFDEVQEVPEALTSLSTLMKTLKNIISLRQGLYLMLLFIPYFFPVGKVDFLSLHPMSFSEFLLATDNEPLNAMIEELDFKLVKVFSSKLT